MKRHFVERLIVRTTGKESTIQVRPSITPDVLPETYLQAIQTYLPLRLTPIAPSEPGISARESIDSTAQKLSLEPKQGKLREDDSVEKRGVEKGVTTKEAVSEVEATRRPHDKLIPEPEEGLKPEYEDDVKKSVYAEVEPYIQTVREEAEIRHTETKVIEPEEVTTRFQAEAPKKERKGTMTLEDVKEDLQTTKRYDDQTMATNGVYPHIQPSDGLESVSSVVISNDKKERGLPEIISSRVPSKSKYSQERLEDITGRPRPLEQAATGLTRSYTWLDRLKQEGKRLEQLKDTSEPTVSINIERVEVRAIMPEKPLVWKDRVPTLPLEEYLKQRREGGL